MVKRAEHIMAGGLHSAVEGLEMSCGLGWPGSSQTEGIRIGDKESATITAEQTGSS